MLLKSSKSLEKKTTLYKERKEEKRKQFLEQLKEIPEKDRIYLDESGVNRYLYRNYARASRGKKVLGEVSGKRFVRESFISALYEGKFLAPMCFQGTCNTELFNTWLKQILIPELQPGKVLILDNASFHRSNETKKLIETAGCRLLFLPPYSPDLNPIEKYWANLKVKIREFLRNFTRFNDAVDGAFTTM